jgi:hypothetical protein
MADMVPFTDNYSDLSNLEGFQFEFHCERCGNGYRSAYQRNVKETSKGVLRGLGNMFGGKIQEISGGIEAMDVNRATNSPAKDRALRDAVAEVSPQFAQCRGCGNWVCKAVCWNVEIGQCLVCSPSVAEEISRAQAAAQIEQVQEKVREVDWTHDLDLANRAKVTCASCGAKVDGGKFCPECGEKLTKGGFCAECGAEMKDGAKFCAECGTKV